MNNYYKFVLLFVLPFIFFSCEKQDIEEELATYEGGMLGVFSASYRGTGSNNKKYVDIFHLTDDGTITYDLYKKANKDSLNEIHSIYEGRNSIYVLQSKEIVVVDKSTFVKKKVITSPNGNEIENFVFIKPHETAIITTQYGGMFWVSLTGGQVLKDISDEYIQVVYNEDRDELVCFVDRLTTFGATDYGIDYRDAATFNYLYHNLNGSVIDSYLNPSRLRFNHDSEIYTIDANQNLWRVGTYEYNSFEDPYLYFEVVVRYDGNSIDDTYNSIRRRYTLKRNHTGNSYNFAINKNNNTLYYLENKGLYAPGDRRNVKQIDLSEVKKQHATTSPLGRPGGNDFLLEDLATTFISLPHNFIIGSININSKNGDVILIHSEPDLSTEYLHDQLTTFSIYNKQGIVKTSFTTPKDSTNPNKIVSLYGTFRKNRNYFIFRD